MIKNHNVLILVYPRLLNAMSHALILKRVRKAKKNWLTTKYSIMVFNHNAAFLGYPRFLNGFCSRSIEFNQIIDQRTNIIASKALIHCVFS